MSDGAQTAGRTHSANRLLERDSELAAIDTLVGDAVAGESRLLIVEGPAGIGKSRLVAETRRTATAAGIRVRSSRGGELERDFPFGVVRQLFEADVLDPAGDALLGGSAAAARPIFASVPSSQDDVDASFAALHGLYWLTVNLADDEPLMLVVDDLHWCDRPSLRFLAYLVRRLEGLPISVVTSLRPAEPGVDVALIAELTTDPIAVSLRPMALTAAASGELIGARLGTEPAREFADLCHGATGGNPLLLSELLKAMEAEGVQPDAAHADVVQEIGPRAASRAVLVRLSRLPNQVVDVARSLAVLGDGADLTAVATLAGVDRASAAEAIGELARVEIVRSGTPLGFVHPLVRAAVYTDLPAARREECHARAARILADARVSACEVAAQLIPTPGRGDPWVVETLETAARTALGRGAPDSAAAYLNRALEEPPAPERRAEFLLRVGATESMIDGPASLEHLRAAYETASDPFLRAQAAAALAPIMVLLGMTAEGAAVAERGMAELGSEHGDLRLQLEATRLIQALWDPESMARNEPLFTRYRTESLGDGPGARLLSGAAAYHWAMTGGPADECVRLARHAVGGGVLVRAANGAIPYVAAQVVLLYADAPDGLDAVNDAYRVAHESGSLYSAIPTRLFRGLGLAMRGELAEAEQLERAALHDNDVWGFVSVRLFPGALLARVLIDRGDLAGAAAALAHANQDDTATQEITNSVFWISSRLRFLVASGALDEALRVADDLPRPLRPHGAEPRLAPVAVAGSAGARTVGPPRGSGDAGRGGAGAGPQVGRPRDRGPRPAGARRGAAGRGAASPRGGRRRHRRHAGAARARQGPRRPRDRPAPRPPPDGGPRATAQGARAGNGVRRGGARRARADGAAGHRRAPAHGGDVRGRRAHGERAARGRGRRRGAVQQGHRPGALRHPEDDRGASLERLSQARDPVPPRAHGGARGMTEVAEPPPLLERDGEVTALGGLVTRAVAGDARFVLVEGPAGIGKSRLMGEVRRQGAAAGMRVLAARGSELERDFPYGVVRQLFESELIAPAARKRRLAGAAATAAPIFDALAPDAGAEDVSFAALHGLYWLTLNLAGEAPLALVVDDLHWSDRPSLRFLAYLSSRIEGNSLLVASGLRPAEPGTDMLLVGEIAHAATTVPIQPAPLSEDATARLVADRLGTEPDPAFTAACHRATGGNPFLLTELLRAMQAEDISPTDGHVGAVNEVGPRAVSRGVLLRLSRLAEPAIQVARSLAILGDGADVARLGGLADLDGAQAAEATGALARAEIIRPDTPMGFVHPLVREAIYLDIPPGERQRLHGLAARRAVDAGDPAERVAAQLLATAPAGEPWAVEALRRAAREATARGAPDSAAVYLRRALEEPPAPGERPEITFQLGLAEAQTDGQAGMDRVRAAYEIAAEPLMRDTVATALVHLMFYAHPHEGVALAERAAAAMDPTHEDLRRQLEAGRLTLAFVDTTAVSIDDPGFAAARAAPRIPGVGARMLDGLAAYQWSLTDGTADECARLAIRALDDGELTRAEPSSIPWLAAVETLIAADRDEALETLQAGVAAAHRTGSGFVVTGVQGFLARCLTLRGDLEGAEAAGYTARATHDTWGGFVTVRVPAASFLAQALVERGNLAAAEEAFAWANAPAELPLHNNTLALWFDARLRYLAATSNWLAALELSHECEQRFPRINPGRLPWRTLRAEALHALGRTGEAVAVATEELPLSRRWRAPRTVGRTLRVLGVVSRDESLVREAVDVLAGTPPRLELAKALRDLGVLLRLDRRPAEAREPLREALELATAAGADGLAGHVRSELAATGARPRTDARSGVGALTASEARVARAAADGQSNKDIAQALYVTPKTIEVHLSNAYRKLGIRSRRELQAALAG